MTDREYNECVQLHADQLYRFVLKNIRNAEDARDIVQSAFEKMWVKRANVDPQTGKSYLFTVAYHELIDQVRKRKKTTDLEDQPIYHRGHDQKRVLEIALARLTETQRSLILLKDLEGYSYEEIAVITGLNITQVKVYLHRARLQVRNFIGSVESVLD
jgi:RNA polymerase sigma factor (sigma-70 family)